jgi:hypothetical protein
MGSMDFNNGLVVGLTLKSKWIGQSTSSNIPDWVENVRVQMRDSLMRLGFAIYSPQITLQELADLIDQIEQATVVIRPFVLQRILNTNDTKIKPEMENRVLGDLISIETLVPVGVIDDQVILDEVVSKVEVGIETSFIDVWPKLHQLVVSEITTTRVLVSFPEANISAFGVRVRVEDPGGSLREVNPIHITTGQTTAEFQFVTPIPVDVIYGTWFVDGVIHVVSLN